LFDDVAKVETLLLLLLLLLPNPEAFPKADVSAGEAARAANPVLPESLNADLLEEDAASAPKPVLPKPVLLPLPNPEGLPKADVLAGEAAIAANPVAAGLLLLPLLPPTPIADGLPKAGVLEEEAASEPNPLLPKPLLLPPPPRAEGLPKTGALVGEAAAVISVPLLLLSAPRAEVLPKAGVVLDDPPNASNPLLPNAVLEAPNKEGVEENGLGVFDSPEPNMVFFFWLLSPATVVEDDPNPVVPKALKLLPPAAPKRED